jgi:hypothetical protein
VSIDQKLFRKQLAFFIAKRPALRLALLCFLLLASIVLYIVLIQFAQPEDSYVTPFLGIWIWCFVPYFAACALVLLAPSSPGRWRLTEVGVILLGALIFRLWLLPQLPNLSRDSWRYVWDARVTLHGFSPYEYAPGAPLLKSFRDALIYGNSRFRNVPTVYPPVAEGVYVLSYLLAPSNLFALKAIFIGFDMLTCVGLALLLLQRGRDPRLMLLYAWCPLPIVEFAIEGHVDVLTTTFMVFTLLFAKKRDENVWWRILLGVLIACATLTKIYPILLLLVVTRRRDWAIPVACFVAIMLAYIPYIILGHGQVLGFFSTYASEQSQNAGVVPLLIRNFMDTGLHARMQVTVLVQYGVDVLLVGPVCLLVLWLRWQERISMEMAALILIGTVYSVSTHIFPWYTIALLLFVPLLIEPLWRATGLRGKGIAVAAIWYFVCTSLYAYYFRNTNDWTLYYRVVYGVTVLIVAVGIVYALKNFRAVKEPVTQRVDGMYK